MSAMSEAHIQDDVIGRVRNTRLTKAQSLLPIFEAVVNSLHAIEDSKRPGLITVALIRASQETIAESISAPLIGFEITDNGVGFNEANYTSFCTADSRLKLKRGGKGIGRFVWLKAFARVDVDSTYLEDGKTLRRSFKFVAQEPPIQDLNIVDAEGEPKTVVRLTDIHRPFEGAFPATAETLADRLTRHLLIFLIKPSCAEIRVFDRSGETFLDVKKHFEDQLLITYSERSFELKSEKLKLTFVYMHAGATPTHKLVLCADGREVLTYALNKFIPDVTGRAIPSPEGEPSELWVVVSGDYLDRTVSQERTGFMFADSESHDADGLDLTQTELMDAVRHECEQVIRGFLDRVEQEKVRRIENFAMHQEPEYRVLLKHASEAIRRIPADVSDIKLEVELHKILHSVEIELKEEGKEFLSDVESANRDPEYVERYDRYVDKLLDYRQSELAKYVIHRRTIIELLNRALGMKSDGTFSLEDQVHKILYPMRTTSEDIDFGQQNLWLIDEKLTYHYHLASDTELSVAKVVDVESRKRPDVLIFDRPSAFVEGEYPFDSVVIIELKRPQRNAYGTEEKDPCQQVLSYIEDIQGGKVIGEDGQHLQISDKTRFYCYILADITPNLRRIVKRNDFFETPDGLGYFKFTQNFNAYIEIVSYRKLVEDAKRRNRVLFEKLSLPGYSV
jgi:hypothetical protein